MKKWFIGLLFIVAALWACLYFFIPNTVSVSRPVAVVASPQGLYRALENQKTWATWWPGTCDSVHQKILFRGNEYTIVDKTLSAFIINITGDHLAAKTNLYLFPASTYDSVQLRWEAQVPITASPATRWQAYWTAKRLQNDLDTLLKTMRAFYSKTENLYHISIGKELIKDSTLVFTSAISKGYPSTPFIYDLIDKLKAYAASQKAKETGFPMLNISTSDSVSFLIKVSLPVDKPIQPSGVFAFRRMPGRFPILVTQVRGGAMQIAQAQQQMENYLNDYKRTAVAIPFQSLITNRLQEPDTTKWTTKIYFPVIEYPEE